MKIQKQREIIIEFERVRIVRKKAKTHVLPCRECRREVDFVALRQAATLFGAGASQIFEFITTNHSHFETGAEGEIYLCLVSLLALMKAKTNIKSLQSYPSRRS